jgi:hypothetical protein
MVIVMVMTCTQNVYAAGMADALGSELILTAADDDGKELPESDSSFEDADPSSFDALSDIEGSEDESDGKELPEDDSFFEDDDIPGVSEDEFPLDDEEVLDPDVEEVDEVSDKKLLGDSDHKHCVCGSDSCSDHHADTEWTAWELTDSLPTVAGYYYLTDDVTLTNNYEAAAGVYLCINGKTIDMDGYRYSGSGKLAITNCKGKNTGGIVCDNKNYYDKFVISAPDLELRNLDIAFSNMSGTFHGVGNKGSYGSSSSSYLFIDNCRISLTNSAYYSYLVDMSYCNDATIKNSDVTMTGIAGEYAYGVIVSGYIGKVVMSSCTVSVTGSGNGIKAFDLTQNKEQGTGETEAANITDCSFYAESTSTSTSGYPFFCEGATCESGGESYFTYNNCSFTATSENQMECTAFEQDNGGQYAYYQLSKAILNDCTATATTGGNAYALSSEANLTVNGGSAVAVGAGATAGLYCQGQDNIEFLLSGVSITGTRYGIYEPDYDYEYISAKNCTIATTDTQDGYGIYAPYSNLYLGGATEISGAKGGVYKTAYRDSSYNTRFNRPAIYAWSKDDETALTIDSGKQISVYYAYQSSRPGDQIITEGMTEGLVNKLTISYPEGFSIDKDGKLVTPVQSSVTTSYDYTKGKASAYKDPEYSIFLPNGKAYEGDTVYIKAIPEPHYSFTEWVVKNGGVTVASPTSAESSFVMGSSYVEVRAEFVESPSYTIKYNGGSQSDGTVTISDGKKYAGETATLATRTFVNKDTTKSQTGWSLSDGGEKAYALGGEYTADADLNLYPYWEGNHTITFKYGNYPAEGHTSDEVVFTATKVPHTDYIFIGKDIEDKFGYEEGGTASSPYYYIETSDGKAYRMIGFSKNADGSTCDYTWISGTDNYKYTDDEHITLYPAWERLYKVSFAPGQYGMEREEPLEVMFKVKGRSITLPGRVDSSGIKYGAYESTREWFTHGGWTSEDGGSRQYNLAGSYSADEDVTLYPYWETIYKITYLPGENGYSPSGEDSVVVKKLAGVTYNIYYGLFIRPGYTQTSWNTKEDGTGTVYSFGRSYSSDADLTLYPAWTKNYTITYVPDDKCDQDSLVKEYKIPGQDAAIRGDVLTAKGYYLEGYTTTEGGTEVEYAAGDSYRADADLTLYPVWRPETYSLWLGLTQVTTDNMNNILGEGKAVFDPETCTLTLKGVSITDYRSVTDDMYAGMGLSASRYAEGSDRGIQALNIVLEGENSIVPALPETLTGYGIFAAGLTVTVSGSGTLTVGKDDSSYPMMAGISTNSLKMKGGTLTVFGNYVGIYATPDEGYEGVIIEGGTLNATAVGDDGMAMAAVSDGAAAVRISGGTVNLETLGNKTTDDSNESIPSALAARTVYHDAVIIEGGTVNLTNSGNAGYGIEVSDYGTGQEGAGGNSPQYNLVNFYAGDVTINSVTAAVATELNGPSVGAVNIGEGVSVKAGADAAGAATVTDFETNYKSYRYAAFEGGTAPEKTFLFIGNETVTSSNLTGEGWSYAPDTATLTLESLELDSVYEENYGEVVDTYGIYAPDDISILLVGESSIGLTERVPETGIYSEGTLSITGSGQLDVFAIDEGICADEDITLSADIVSISDSTGIRAYSGLTVNGGTLHAATTGKSEGYAYGIYAANSVEINDGNVTVAGREDGIYAYDDVYINGGTVNISASEQGLECDDYVQSGADVTIISTTEGPEALNFNAINPTYGIHVSGGTLYAEAEYTPVLAGRTGQTITIDAGVFKAHARATERYNGTGMTTTIQYKNVNINGGRLEVTGYGYGIYGDRSSTWPNVYVTGGSLLIDMTPSRDSKINCAVSGMVNVSMPSSRYCRTRDGKNFYRTGSYSFYCNGNAADDGTDYVNVSAAQTITYKPGPYGLGEDIVVPRDAGAPVVLENALFTHTGGELIQGGWNTDPYQPFEVYGFGDLYTKDGDAVFYPDWADPYKTTYDPGPYAKEASLIYEDIVPGHTYAYLRDALYTRDGFIQTGWNTVQDPASDNPGTHYDLGQRYEVSEYSLMLYPEWTSQAQIKHTLTLDKGFWGRGDVPEPVELLMDEEYQLPGAVFTRTGYLQDGWSLTDDGEKLYEPDAVITIEQDTVLFPAWTEEEPVDDKPYWIEFEGADKVYIEGTEKPVYVLDYCGAALKPVVSIYDGDELLTEKTDYTIAFKNNTNANMTAVDWAEKGKAVTEAGLTAKELSKLPYVTVTGKGNYNQKEIVYFAIRPMDISAGSAFAPDATDDYVFVYAEKSGKAVVNKPVPAISGTVNGKAKKLAKTKEFTFRYYKADLDGSGNYQTDDEGLYRTAGNALDGIADEGKYVVWVDGAGNFSGSLTLKAQVTKTLTPIGKAKVTYAKNLAYNNGDPVVQTNVKVVLNKKELTENVDYEVSYREGTPAEIGTYTMLVTGIGSYAGTVAVKFNVVGTALSKAKHNGFVSAFTYNGEVQKQTGFVLYVGANELREGRDYTVVYTNASQKVCEPEDVGTYTATYTGCGAYSGKVTKKYKINAYDAAKDPNKWITASVDVDASGIEYSKGGAKPTITLKFRGDVVDSANYVLSYKNNTAVNDMSNAKKLPTVIATCKGNLKGKVTAGNFKIKLKDFSKVDFVIANKAFANKANNYTTTIIATDTDGYALKAGTDYDKNVVYKYNQNVEVINAKKPAQRNAGDVVTKNDIVPVGTSMKAEVAPKGNYAGAPIVLFYEIHELDISKAKVNFAKDFYFERGTAIELTEDDFTLYYKNGKTETLINPAEYEIVPGSFKNNIKAGTASFQVCGTGNTGGVLTIKFRILPKWLATLLGL